MARLIVMMSVLALQWPAPSAAAPTDRWGTHIQEASRRFSIPAAWIRRVMTAESGGRTTLAGRPIESRAGAMGLMQLMPATWREVRARLRLGADPHDPRDNILAGAFYLREMHERFGYPGLFAAYNAGPARYSRHLATGRPLPAETLHYVSAVAGSAAAASPPAERKTATAIFVALGQGRRAPESDGSAIGEPHPLLVSLSSAREGAD